MFTRKHDCRGSLELFSLADRNEIQNVISTLSIANAYFFLYDVLKIKEARSIIGTIKVLVNTYSLSNKIVDLALNDLSFKDFEDSFQF